MNSILIIADSFGGERKHEGKFKVQLEETYPEILKRKILLKIEHDCKNYRKFIELINFETQIKKFDIIIIQLGIVDIYPRPLNQKITMSQSILSQILKKIVRIFRSFVLKYIYNKPWSSYEELENVFEWLLNFNKKIIFVGCSPITDIQEKESPGASNAIMKFNYWLQNKCFEYNSTYYIDVFKYTSENISEFLHPIDSHLTKSGNSLYADLIISKIDNLND